MTTTYTITTTDEYTARLALDAHKWRQIVADLDSEMRAEVKYTDNHTNTAGWRERLLEMVRDEGLDLYE